MKIVSVIMTILILVLFGRYLYYNTSLFILTFDELSDRNVPFEKYLKCAKEGEAARVNDSDVDMPAHCCGGLKMKYAYSKSGSTSYVLITPGDIGTCAKRY